MYRVFGLTVEADRPIPGLTAQTAPPPVDVRICLAGPPDSRARRLPQESWYVSQEIDAGPPALQVWRLGPGTFFRFLYADGTEFLVDSAGSYVWASTPPSSTVEDTATYLLGPVLGFVLRRRGITGLHASAVSLGTRAIAFVGSPGAGKSTLAALLVRLGQPALSDDVLALMVRDGVFHAVPAYEQLRLWPDSVALLFGSTDALPPLTPTWNKRGFVLPDASTFQDQPLPLAAVYVLDERSPDARPRITSLPGRARLLSLLGNTSVSYLMDGAERRREFDVLTRLATMVPVRQLSVPEGTTHAADLLQAILDDCEGFRCTPSATMVR
jgi:hypothetical protein